MAERCLVGFAYAKSNGYTLQQLVLGSSDGCAKRWTLEACKVIWRQTANDKSSNLCIYKPGTATTSIKNDQLIFRLPLRTVFAQHQLFAPQLITMKFTLVLGALFAASAIAAPAANEVNELVARTGGKTPCEKAQYKLEKCKVYASPRPSLYKADPA